MDPIDRELAELLSQEKVFRAGDYQYFVLSEDPAPRMAQIFVSRDDARPVSDGPSVHDFHVADAVIVALGLPPTWGVPSFDNGDPIDSEGAE